LDLRDLDMNLDRVARHTVVYQSSTDDLVLPHFVQIVKSETLCDGHWDRLFRSTFRA